MRKIPVRCFKETIYRDFFISEPLLATYTLSEPTDWEAALQNPEFYPTLLH